jgi:voltage-gated potassium channel
MKMLTTQVLIFLRNKPDRRNLLLLFRFLLVLFLIISVYAVVFTYLMEQEGRSYSLFTGYYWTLTVMCTLGFGDITFHGDMGRLFSVVVLVTGMLFLLILFPFTFINFFYSPWMKAQERARVPKELPFDVKGHVILTKYGLITDVLIKKLKQFNYQYTVLVSDIQEGIRLRDMGIEVMLGDLGDPETYRMARVEAAALVATMESDVINTNVAFTVRGISKSVKIIATCSNEASDDILKLAGCDHVLHLGDIMGLFLARRANGGDAGAHLIGEFGELKVAEALVTGSSLVGLKLRETKLRQEIGVNVVGVWERGRFQPAEPDTEISASTVLVLAGTAQQIDLYNQTYCVRSAVAAPVLIIGGGRVGRATGRYLLTRGLDYRIVEKNPDRALGREKVVLGDAAALEVLKEAGIDDTHCVIITSHDDDVNVYLTIYCRLLRPDVQIITRSNLERNLGTMHRAGSDFVMSYASMGANTVFNLLERGGILMVAEGLDLIEVTVPEALEGKSIATSSIRKETGCTVIALKYQGITYVNPEPETILPKEGVIILIGTAEAEKRFFEEYGS